MKKILLLFYVVICSACAADTSSASIAVKGTGWERAIVFAGNQAGCAGADGVNLADRDGDGDTDFTVGCEQTSSVWVIDQPSDPWGSAWTATNVGGNPSVEDAIFVNSSGQGIDSVISVGEGKKVKNHPEPFTSSTVLYSAPWRILQVARADIDCDGDDETIIGGRSVATNVAKIGWLTTPGGAFTEMGIVGHTMSLIPFQADGDCVPEFLVTDKTWYYDPTQPNSRNYSLRGIRILNFNGSTWDNTTVANLTGDVGFAALGDIDNDGDGDIVGGTPSVVKIYENVNGDYTSWSTTDLPTIENVGKFHDALICDVTGDQLLDIVLSYAFTTSTEHGVVLLDGSSDWAATSISGPGVSKYDNAECAMIGGSMAIVQTEQNADTDEDMDVGPGLGVVVWRLPS